MIRRLLTETHVAASDRRAVFVGAAAYVEAGGTILRDLFTEDRGGYFEDVALLDLLVTARLGREATVLQQAEGWKWTEVHLDFPHNHGLRRTYPQPVELSAEDELAYDAAKAEFDSLTEQYQSAEELPDDVDAKFGELEAEIERLEAKRQAYNPDDIVRCGAFVILGHDGMVRIERGFVRAEDATTEPEADVGSGDTETIESVTTDDNGNTAGDRQESDPEAGDESNALSDILVRDLTAHRTLGLRLALSEQPDVAILTVVHTLAAQTFYRGAEVQVLDIHATSTVLASHADGIEDTQAGKAWADRHANWAAQMPRNVNDLWAFVIELDHDSRMALFAHCVALTVNAVVLPWERKPRAAATANKLAEAVSLDMTAHWTPTVRTYLGRTTKANILAAVREGASVEAAERMADMKKQAMAEAAEQLLLGTGWLPTLLRTPRTDPEQAGETGAESVDAYHQAAAE